MADLGELLATLPIDQLAARVGASPDQVRSAAASALPALLSGLASNVATPAGEAALAGALDRHDNDLLTGGVDLAAVDVEDGAKITRHIFGDNTDAAVARLGGSGGADSGLVAKLLPMLAPIVLAYLAKQVGGSKGALGGGVLGTVLGTILAGAAQGV